MSAAGMGKRKKGSSFEHDSSDEGGRSKRSKKYDLSEQLQELMESLRNYKTPDTGRVLCEAFIRAPKRRNLAEYYDVVASPIDMLRIQQKIRMDEYDDLEQFSRDVELLVGNAKSYYKADSAEYADAEQLWEVFTELREDIFGTGSGGCGGGSSDARTLDSGDDDGNSNLGPSTSGQGNASGAGGNQNTGGGLDSMSNSESEGGGEDSQYEELFSSVMMATSDDGRQLSTMFELLPSKATYPDYYEVVAEPIDLKTIASRIQQAEYTTLGDIEKDLLLMINNAKKYNAPGSQIYKDANSLRKIITTKRGEIDLRKSQPAKSSERIRAKRNNPYQPKWSAITASLKYEEDDEAAASAAGTSTVGAGGDFDDTVNFSDSEDSESNPQWLLYNAVKDTPYSEPFFRLPSRRHYPDYYREIKQPISLAQICSRIKSGCYDSVSRLASELTLVFDNAMAYNRPDSKLYKDAAKLKKILQIKSKEIINVFKEEGGATSGEADDEEEEEDGEDEDENEASQASGSSGRGGSSKWNTSSSSNRVVARSAGSRTASRKSSKSMVNAMSQELKNVRRSQKAGDSGLLKKRLRALYRTLIDARDEEERYLIDPFMDKPSKKLYPDYYEIIASPIDMKTIDGNIKNDVYQSVDELLADFRLMFDNCRRYNEDGSQIYQDADVLERLLRAKVAELGPLPVAAERPKRERVRPSSGNQLKMKTLFETVRDYTDSKGRFLSTIFMKLPSRVDFPDYYDVIRKPICLEKIGSRVRNCIYDTVEDLLGDIILMLDNACKYNEPDSQVFKDALTLQQVALQTKIDLNEDSVNGIPDVKIIVQDLLTNLFISVYNHQDEEGRCFSDSINELTELGDKSSDVELRTLNFDLIKRNLNAGRYRRLDRFQQDMFEVFERARRMSRTDSQAFEDSIELQQYFISLRNDLCKGGEVLQSSALHYDLPTLNAHIEALRREKVPREITEEAEAAAVKTEEDSTILGSSAASTSTAQPQPTTMIVDNDETMVMVNDVVYKVGDFVYVTPNAGAAEPHIINIEKFIRDPSGSGQVLLHGCWFYRPAETFHIPTRRFMEKEIFKTDNYTSTPLSNVSGKCCVMFVKDYFRSRPLNFDDADVYVCESRYSCKSKSFKKIKVWTYDVLSNVAIVPREVPLPMNRVPSVFKDQCSMSTGAGSAEVKTLEEELMIDGGDGKEGPDGANLEGVDDKGILDVPRPNVICAPPEGVQTSEGLVYYEQYTIPAGTFRVGDCCYVRTDQERNLICRIDRMWTDEAGNPYFHGPWFVQQAELPPNTVGSFYPQEVFLSSIEDTNPLLSICERCAVLDVTDYIIKRPTEFLEKDVYVCEIRYLEHEKKFEPLPPEGLVKFVRSQSHGVVEDELYFFRRPLMLQKDSYVLPQVVEPTAQDQQAMYNGSQQQQQQQMMDGSQQIRGSLDVDMTDESNMSSISTSAMGVQQQHQQIPMQMIAQQQQQLQLQQQAQLQAQAQQQQMIVDPNTGLMVPVMAGAAVPQGIQIVQGTPTATPATPAVVATPSNVLPATPATPVTSAAVAALKKPKTPKRLVTGYIIFASEVRKSVVEANPDCSFGDISRIIGSQWKILTQEQKGEYEQRAAKQNAEVKEAAAAESALMEQLGVNPSSPAVGNESIPNGVFECHWEHKCDYQFEDVNDLYEHLTAEPNGHVWVSYAETKDKEPGEFQCMFHGCGRVRKGAPPFPTVTRLVRHCKEVHIAKAVAKVIDPEKRSKNYVPSSKVKPVEVQQQQQQQQIQQQQIQQQQQLQQQGVSTTQLIQTPQGLQMVQTTGQGHPPGTQTIQIPASALAHHQQGGQIQTIQIRDPTSGNIQTAIVTTGPPPGGQTFQLATGTGGHHPHIIGTTTINGQTIQIAAAPHPSQQQQQQQQTQQQTMVVPTSGGGVQQVHFTTTTQQQAQQQQQQNTSQQTPQQQTPQQQQVQQQQQAQIQAQIQAQVQQQIQAQLQAQQQQIVKPQTANQAVQVKPVEPLFSAPPRTNRLVHTHTYMKYIESLKPDRRYISNWERQLSASPANCSFNAALLNGASKGNQKKSNGTTSTTSADPRNPISWLENGANGHGSVVDALWTLRDFMMKDALSLASI